MTASNQDVELIERLRRETCEVEHVDAGGLSLVEVPNPVCQEAAARLAELSAEVERASAVRATKKSIAARILSLTDNKSTSPDDSDEEAVR